MTCHYCQTWILDDDHRCPRCGRRVRMMPSRISPTTYPIAAAATAPAYDPEPEPAQIPPDAQPGEQARLFRASAAEPRIIPFDSLTSASERDAIRQRAAQTHRQTKISATKRPGRSAKAEQARLDFPADFSEQEAIADARLQMFCEMPVATARARLQAALIDTLWIMLGLAPAVALFFYLGGHFPPDQHSLPFLALATATIPLYYKLLWALAGKDTPGMRAAGLELVDFDGKTPGRDRRFTRLFGATLSLLAAGIGMIWVLVDEERLGWHDHISGTFPTFSETRR